MQRIRTGVSILFLACTVQACASDWQYAGFAKVGQDETFLFYDAGSVQHPNPTLVRYWLKAITRANLDRYYVTHEKSLVDKVARKVAVGYVPKFYELEAIRSQHRTTEAFRNAIIEISSYEVVANEPDALLKSQLLYELDCAERKSRVLEMISYDAKGEISGRRGSRQDPYQFIPPDSNGEWQSQLLCIRR